MPDQLTCAVDPGHPVASVRLTGKLGLASATVLRSTLHKVLADQPVAVLIDVAGLAIDDDLAVLAFSVAARRATVWPGSVLLLYGASADTRRALEQMGVARQVVVCHDRKDAEDRAANSPVPPRLTERLPPIPEAAGFARRLVSEACRRWGLSNLAEVAEILVTELVGNAVRHALPPIDLSLVRRGRYLYIGVRDHSPELPHRLTVEEPASYGRGLLVVDAFATAWGCTPSADGKVVWATLRPYPR